MKKKIRLKKDNNKRQRLTDIDIDEISLVDKPAIEDEFIITKRISKKERIAMAKKKNKKSKSSKKKSKKTKKGQLTSLTKVKEIQKKAFWGQTLEKSLEEDHGDFCCFCGISEETEAETIKMGLMKGVCFKCAVNHMEKGVLEDCLSEKFDVDKFAKKNPKIKI